MFLLFLFNQSKAPNRSVLFFSVSKEFPSRPVHNNMKRTEVKKPMHQLSPLQGNHLTNTTIPMNQTPDIIFQENDLSSLRRIAFQLISAIHILHQEGIIHADLKPENCFVHIPPNPSSGNSSSDHKNTKTSAPNAQNAAGPLINPPQFLSFSNTNNGIPFQGSGSGFLGVSSLENISNPVVPSSSSPFTLLRQLPANFEIKLADFSNAIHQSEIPQYYEEFAIQSAPYRAPEVLIGIPFTASIDVWSVGIILLELCLMKPFITTDNRQEIIHFIETKIGKFSKIRFSGGKFSHLLFESKSFLSSSSSSTVTSNFHSPLPPPPSISSSAAKESSMNYRIENMKSIKRLLMKTVQFDLSNYQLSQFFDFLSGLLIMDPTYRMTTKDAFQHSFLTSLFTLPLPLCVPFQKSTENETKKKRIRNNNNSNVFSNKVQFQSMKLLTSPTPSSTIPISSSSAAASTTFISPASGNKRLLSSTSQPPPLHQSSHNNNDKIDDSPQKKRLLPNQDGSSSSSSFGFNESKPTTMKLYQIE
jgi:serine/threonine protein kinase